MNYVIENPVTTWIIYYRANHKKYATATEFDTARYQAYTKEQAVSLFEQATGKGNNTVLAVAKDFDATITNKNSKFGEKFEDE